MRMQVIFESGEIIEEEVGDKKDALIRVLNGMPYLAEVLVEEDPDVHEAEQRYFIDGPNTARTFDDLKSVRFYEEADNA